MSINFNYPNYLWLLLLLLPTIGVVLLNQRGIKNFRHWASLIIRITILMTLIFTLAGIQLRLPSNLHTAVFVLDVSDSISAIEQERGENFIRKSITEVMPAGDMAAIILFGEDAVVERLANTDQRLTELTSIPITTHTDIAGALQLAVALFPQEGSKRVVLLSDGQENIKQAIDQAELAAIQNIELLYYPLGEDSTQTEVILESLQAPTSIRQGQDIELTANIFSTEPMQATLHYYMEGSLIETREIRLLSGENYIQTIVPETPDYQDDHFRRFKLQVIPELDTRLQNNEASAFTVIHGPPNILIVEGDSDEGINLFDALKANEMQIERIPPHQMPTSLSGLAGYDAIILVNVNATQLPSGVMELLPVFIRDLGKGLLMVGGQDTFGAGGYIRSPLEEALPVDMDVRDKEFQANLALVLAVDKSGSMGRCHCDNPDLTQAYERIEVGQPKVDIAKEAIMRAAGALSNQDYLGVIAFDSSAHWALHLDNLVDPLSLEQAISSFQAEGQTNIFSGVQTAYQALQSITARRKHIILLTDGWINRGDITPLAQQMQKQDITLSVVAAGQGSAEYLETLAQVGGGRYYPAKNLMDVPDIFLKETITSAGQYIIEEPFYPMPSVPSPILRNIDSTTLPPLYGYNGTTAKNTARQVLITPRGDPLLTTWQYGLGRAAVWTSDLKGQWATQWITWREFPRFSAQLTNWILPTPQTEGLNANATIDENNIVVQLEAFDPNGQPINFLDVEAIIIDPALETSKVLLDQIGAGKYQARQAASQPGAYLVRLGANQNNQSLGQVTLGVTVPYSPEYKNVGINKGLLAKLANITGGSQIDSPEGAFAHNLPSASYPREIWYGLLVFVVLLFPLDVAIRRLVFSAKDLQKLRNKFKKSVPSTGKIEREISPGMLRLFQARQRARERKKSNPQEEKIILPTKDGQLSEVPEKIEKISKVEDEAAIDGKQEDMLDRLHNAKKRARR